MTEYSLSGDRILIVPGYTDEELLRMGSNKSDNSDEKKDEEKAGIAEPAAFYIEGKEIEYTPNIRSYEGFESAEGLIPIEKACNRYAEVSMEVFVHQNLSNMKGSIIIDGKTKEARLRVTDNSTLDEETIDGSLKLSRYVDPSEFTEEYIEIRNNFFKDLDGRPLTVVSPLFPPIAVGYIDDVNYNIPEGEENPTYSITIKEYNNTGF